MKEAFFRPAGGKLPGVQEDVHGIEMPSREIFWFGSTCSSEFRLEEATEPAVKQRPMDESSRWFCLRRWWSPTVEFGPRRPSWLKVIISPRSKEYQLWNRVFIVTCLVAIFLDPLFFYVPVVQMNDLCFDLDRNLAIAVTVLRTLIDFVYVIHMWLEFRTAFVAPSSRVFGIGELVEDTNEIARRYLKSAFWVDLVVILPLPQVVMWLFFPFLRTSRIANTKIAVILLVIFHYVPRLIRMFFIVKNSEMVRSKDTGVFMETVWAGAAYNLLLYLLASHVIGACWYLLTVERQDTCWRSFCEHEDFCNKRFFNCRSQLNDELKGPRADWLSRTEIPFKCVANSGEPTSMPFNFGLYSLAMENNITSGLNFVPKYFYCLWFGLNGLSSLGQGFKVSTYTWEVLFAIIIFISGLLLFALLIGNVQKYILSAGIRVDEMRVKRRDTEEWMNHRRLPGELRNRVRRYEQYKWLETQGVDEQALLRSLPNDLRRDIKRHLCLGLLKRVELFNQMDERLLDAICEVLQPALHTEGSYLVQEGDPVVEMTFIIRGHLDSMTTNGGRTGFLSRYSLGPGDFCGEQLLTWALESQHEKTLPSSTRTIMALGVVEAFSLSAKDLRFVAGQFRMLHSKKLQHTFKYLSHQWRTWAATFIQISWRRYRLRKLGSRMEQDAEQILRAYDNAYMQANEIMPISAIRHSNISLSSSNLSKPLEPDFFRDDSHL
ncbi:cyclic nucleotide gated channel, plant [Marchantia polymorpha subsp. ruderalis]|nr:hypothetical protein MARPO_0044s0062 [Marchantia polymorpha]BBN07496.1 hypothetical protein Mp_4g04110 [Marchantia polymorpha subsp. ruderalis]|eukprot:PTQ39604.1 hypothetical protein MARPO_0044s0062 [Marchantia polymorpha]